MLSVSHLFSAVSLFRGLSFFFFEKDLWFSLGAAQIIEALCVLQPLARGEPGRYLKPAEACSVSTGAWHLVAQGTILHHIAYHIAPLISPWDSLFGPQESAPSWVRAVHWKLCNILQGAATGLWSTPCQITTTCVNRSVTSNRQTHADTEIYFHWQSQHQVKCLEIRC